MSKLKLKLIWVGKDYRPKLLQSNRQSIHAALIRCVQKRIKP